MTSTTSQQWYKDFLEQKQKEKDAKMEKLYAAVLETITDLNDVWEYEDVWERAQLKQGTKTVIQIIDSKDGSIKEDEKIVFSTDGVRIEIGSLRYKIKNWGMRGHENYGISAEIINAIYKVLND